MVIVWTDWGQTEYVVYRKNCRVFVWRNLAFYSDIVCTYILSLATKYLTWASTQTFKHVNKILKDFRVIYHSNFIFPAKAMSVLIIVYKQEKISAGKKTILYRRLSSLVKKWKLHRLRHGHEDQEPNQDWYNGKEKYKQEINLVLGETKRYAKKFYNHCSCLWIHWICNIYEKCGENLSYWHYRASCVPKWVLTQMSHMVFTFELSCRIWRKSNIRCCLFAFDLMQQIIYFQRTANYNTQVHPSLLYYCKWLENL